MINTTIQYFLLLSFLLACLPGQSTHQQDTARAKEFVVVDHVQSLAPADNTQKADKETEDPHPLVFCDLLLLELPAEQVQYFSSAILAGTTAYYSIRAPPHQV